MTRKQAVQWIRSRQGKLFGIAFVKRTTGEMREMVCRQGVTTFLKGGGAPYSFEEKGLLPVYDMVKHQYRSIPIEGIIAIKQEGDWIKVS